MKLVLAESSKERPAAESALRVFEPTVATSESVDGAATVFTEFSDCGFAAAIGGASAEVDEGCKASFDVTRFVELAGLTCCATAGALLLLRRVATARPLAIVAFIASERFTKNTAAGPVKASPNTGTAISCRVMPGTKVSVSATGTNSAPEEAVPPTVS